MACFHPGGNPGANLESISHRCYLREVAFEWELTEETIYLPLGCLQGGVTRCATRRSRGVRISWPRKTIKEWQQLTVPVLNWDCLIGFVACKCKNYLERCVGEHRMLCLSKKCAPTIARGLRLVEHGPLGTTAPEGIFRKDISRASVSWQRKESLETDLHPLTKLCLVRKRAYTPGHLEH